MPASRLFIAFMSASLGSVSLCHAQPAAPGPASPPQVLVLVRQQSKSGKSHARQRLERAKSAVYNRLEVPGYWMEMQSLSGLPEALLFEPFDSFEAVETANAALEPLQQEHPELSRIESGIHDVLSSETTILAVRRDPPGARQINLAEVRFLRMSIVRTNPGETPRGIESPGIIYQVTSGLPGPAFLVFQPLTALSDVPLVPIAMGTVVEDSVYAIEPEMSHVSRAFAEQDQSFWMKPSGQ